jgi:heme-degrading monooxygenase HmoA
MRWKNPMFYVAVKHYLNAEGIRFFPEWFAKVRSFISKQKGFTSIEYFPDSQGKTCMHITLIFDSKANMEAWVSEPVHDDLVAALDQYRVAPWEAKKIDHDAKEAHQIIIYQDGREPKIMPIAYKA